MTNMKAAVLTAFNDLTVQEVPIPVPVKTGSVVVKIKSCGFCQTDFKAIKGIRRNVQFPFIPGHEPSGIVSAVGPGVSVFKEGDEVICQPSGYCGFCRHCREGNSHYCETAFTTGGDGPEDVWPGAFAEYMLTQETCLFHKSPTITFDAAACTEPLSGAWKGVIKHSELEVGESVVVIGTGSIGLLCLMVAHAAGASPLIAIDSSSYARDNALALGATHAFGPDDGRRQVYDIIPEGPDLIIEAAGPIAAVELMTSLRRRGTRWNVFGITTPEVFELEGGLTHFLEGRMDASFGTTPLAMRRAIRLIEKGLVDPEKIITHRFSLDDIHEAIAVMAGKNRNKVIINP